MNIKDFDKHIDKKILSRGLNYFNQGYITSLDSDGDGGWSAEVSGSEDYDYTVTAAISDDGSILSSSCDCPYEYGVYCKHQAAVFYAIRKDTDKDNDTVSKKKKAKASVSFNDILKEIDKNELIAFLTKYAAENKKFKNEFMLNFAGKLAKKSDIFAYARTLIKSSFVGFARDGYIEYKDGNKVIKGAEKVLQTAREDADILKKLNLCAIVIEEMLSASSKYPETYSIYEMAVESMQTIGDIFVDCDETDPDIIKAVDFVLSHISDDKIYGDSWELRIDILETLLPLCSVKYVREKVEECLDIWSKKVSGTYAARGFVMVSSGTKPHIGYFEKSLQALQYEIISRFDGEEALRSFVESHVENDSFRAIAINYAVSDKEYEKAINLCLDGEKLDAGYPGLVNKWLKMRYDVYENTGNIAEQKKIAYKYALEGDFEFYLKLRKLYETSSENSESPESSDEFFDILENLLEALKNPYPKGIYTEILIYEKMIPELLEYCREHIYNIKDFYRHLLPDYAEEVNEIFSEYIRREASQASDRTRYRSVCNLIKEYAKACGNENANEIAESFKKQYVKRPAFLDELKKIKLKRS